MVNQNYHATAIFERVEVLRETMEDTLNRTNRLIEASRELEASSRIRRSAAHRKLDAARDAVRVSMALIS